jgi:hypothetical protein
LLAAWLSYHPLYTSSPSPGVHDTPDRIVLVTLTAGLKETKLPLLQPSVLALIGHIRPQPTNIAAHFLQPLHSPVTSLAVQERHILRPPRQSPSLALTSAQNQCRATRRARGERDFAKRNVARVPRPNQHRQTMPKRPSCQLRRNKTMLHRATARKVSRCSKHRESGWVPPRPPRLNAPCRVRSHGRAKAPLWSRRNRALEPQHL